MAETIIADVYFWPEGADRPIELGGVHYRANPVGASYALPEVEGDAVPDELLALPLGTRGRLTVGVADRVVSERPAVLVRTGGTGRFARFLTASGPE